MTDKPGWVRARRPLPAGEERAVDVLRRNQLASLRSVDEAVGRLLDALAGTGRLSNTLIVFTSDNGLSWGEHRWTKKEAPYEEVIRVPLVVRFDPLVDRPRRDAHLVLNIDIAPTIVAAVGARAPEMDGRSLLPLLASRDVRWRRDFVVEHLEGGRAVPTYCALRTERFTYVRYRNGEEELYDLARDPAQLVNRAADPSLATTREALGARLQELCDPPPPGFVTEPSGTRALVGVAAVAVVLVAEALGARRRAGRRAP